jgi:hypothetical protein
MLRQRSITIHGVSGADAHTLPVYVTSTPPTLTPIRIGKGEIPVAFVMSGTAVRPFSQDVCTSIVCTAFVSVGASVVKNCCRSGLWVRNVR